MNDGEQGSVAARGEQEPRWPAFAAFVAVGLLSLVHAPPLAVGPKWLVVALIAVLLLPALFAHTAGRHRVARWLLTGANALATVAVFWSLGLLIGSLTAKTIAPVELLRSAAALWISNVLVFALWYWRLDAGGPHKRDARPAHEEGAFLFPQMALHDTEWRPRFVDYLFLAFNTSTALSPADTQVLSRWAKLLMMAQASFSLVITVILIGRSVNIL